MANPDQAEADAEVEVEVDGDGEGYEAAPRPARRRPARRQGGKSRGQSAKPKAPPSLAPPGPPPTSLALRYALPLAPPMPGPTKGASGVSAGYGAPFLESVELRGLPLRLREYAAVEDVARSAWWTPPPTPGRLFRAVEATGAATLAEACRHAAVLDALMRAAMGLDE